MKKLIQAFIFCFALVIGLNHALSQTVQVLPGTPVWTTFTPSYACGTATFTNNSSRYAQMGKTIFWEIDVTIASLGTCTTTFDFALPVTAASGAGGAGQETVVTGIGVWCVIQSANFNRAFCRANAALSVNSRISASGLYESN